MERGFSKLFFGFFVFFCGFTGAFAAGQTENADLYKEYQPLESSRMREAIEWTIIYMHNTNDQSIPRALLIGDSICNAYQTPVRNELNGKVNITFWAGSKCVTDPQYFEELSMVLSGNHYDVITFNNGLHSLGTDRREWETAYRQAVLFIRAKSPDAKLLLVTSTPTESPDSSNTSKELGDYAKKVAEELNLGVIDLYQITNDCEDKKPWSDGIHFKKPVVELQGKAVADAILNALK